MGLALFSFAANNTEVAQSGLGASLADMASFLGIVTTVPVIAGIGTGLGLGAAGLIGGLNLAGASMGLTPKAPVTLQKTNSLLSDLNSA